MKKELLLICVVFFSAGNISLAGVDFLINGDFESEPFMTG